MSVWTQNMFTILTNEDGEGEGRGRWKLKKKRSASKTRQGNRTMLETLKRSESWKCKQNAMLETLKNVLKVSKAI